jgi:hypothetical protein
MRLEQGTATAIACVVEIVRITNEKRKHNLTWYRVAKAKPEEAPPRKIRRRKNKKMR